MADSLNSDMEKMDVQGKGSSTCEAGVPISLHTYT